MRCLALLVCSLSLAVAAPVPRDLPPPEVTPGEYQTRWNNSLWQYTLNPDGTCTGSAGACCYVASRSWRMWSAASSADIGLRSTVFRSSLNRSS